jgi:HPt (histidine-containing phosphotransfer) domain-containing protein
MPSNKSTISAAHLDETGFALNPVIDWQRAKELMNGDMQEAETLLRQLLAYMPTTMRQILKAAKANDLEKLLQHVHKLHGACSYCGVPRLKSAAKNLETAIRKQQNMQIADLTLHLENECKALLQAANHDIILNAKS